MGLIFSILVACVGLCELFAFYCRVKRNLILPSPRADLATISDGYIKELGGLRKNTVTNSQKTSNEVDYLSTNILSLRLNSHEDEYKRSLQRLKSPSCNKFPVTEKEINIPRHSSQSLRDFVVSDDLPTLETPKLQSSIQDILIEQEKSSNKSRCGLQETKEITETFILPKPEQFEETEDERSTTVFKDTYFETSTPVDLPHVPKNSVCHELSSIDEVCIDKSQSRSPTPSGRVDVILENSGFNTTQYWTNKVLVIPSKKSRSRSPSPRSRNTNVCEGRDYTFLEAPKHIRVRSKSESNDHIINTPLNSTNKAASNLGFSDERSFPLQLEEEEADNSENVNKAVSALKSISNAKIVRRNTTESENSEVQHSFKSEKTLPISTYTAEEPRRVSSKEKSSSSGVKEASDSKHGEPFWLIFSGEYTKAMNKDWHGQHFCCWQCDESLTGQRYVLRDEHPYCVSCYESVFANACEKCSRTIGIDSKDLSYKDKHWHEACFLCATCGESLVDKQFGSKGDRIYCGSCYDQQFASRCDGCHEIFRAGTKKMEYKTRQWHEKCFCCCVCKVPIGTQSFIPREQEIYCAKCYEEKFATRCIKCNKVITSGGVTYKNEPWHRECFTCTHCTKSLAGERFTSRDEKPYCAECFGELFAKRCTACTKPITDETATNSKSVAAPPMKNLKKHSQTANTPGRVNQTKFEIRRRVTNKCIGGTKFISFEDRHWHNDCFFCASCRTSLVGRGFITDQDDIICPECAKQKLM